MKIVHVAENDMDATIIISILESNGIAIKLEKVSNPNALVIYQQ